MAGADAKPAVWVGEVLDFWCRELPRKAWFEKSDALDHTIKSRFEVLLQHVSDLPTSDALANPVTALATIVVLDQFSRNIHRGTPRAFAVDGLALEVAKQAVARGFDRQLDQHERLFVYLPFEHSEDPDDQTRAVALMSDLGDPEWTRYAEAHKRVIDRFGRFPHRNAIVGRTSTPEETAFLREPGSSF